MEKIAFLKRTKIYYDLTKPSIIGGNLVTTVGGFALASRLHFNFSLLFFTLVGIALIVASGCVFNNYIDRSSDQKMTRTKNRPLARGLISAKDSLIFATALLFLGTFVLLNFVNFLATWIALIGFAIYAVWYSLAKHLTPHATLIGSLAGAAPAAVGYVASSGTLEFGALIIFLIVMFWQMPHFYAIAIYRKKEYEKASVPVLPLKYSMKATKINMLAYLIVFMGTSILPTLYLYTGYLYLVTTLVLGTWWLVTCIQGFFAKNDIKWARKMFLVSLVVIFGICGMLLLPM
ncbi:MAG: heme o synthase [Rhabdochlamydiaceae bacterium]|nr:heme o synthase [Candidatus Amphrikana amoebophyrae]